MIRYRRVPFKLAKARLACSCHVTWPSKRQATRFTMPHLVGLHDCNFCIECEQARECVVVPIRSGAFATQVSESMQQPSEAPEREDSCRSGLVDFEYALAM